MSPRGETRGPFPHSLHKHQTEKMAFCLSASTSTFVGAKVAAKPTAARRTARYVSGRHRARARGCFPTNDARCALTGDAACEARDTTRSKPTRRRERDGRDAADRDRGRFANATACAASFPSRAPRGDIEMREAGPVTTARLFTEPVRFFALFREPRLTPSTLVTLISHRASLSKSAAPR